MRTYLSADFFDIPSGWYWAKTWGENPRPIPVKNLGHMVVLDFGYKSEVYIYKDNPDASDFHEHLILHGPINPPNF